MLKLVYKKRFKGVVLKTGSFYRFKYQAWEHDPKPLIIFMYSIEGINPNTGHQWRIIQGINFTYIPRAMRKRFLKMWMKELERTDVPIRFTWKKVKARYPFLERAVRRYFFKPSYYIQNLEEIPKDEVEKAVISTWSKDFSKKVTTALLGKFKKAMKARANRKKKKKKKQAIRKAKRK
jgi:protoheme ferro-lyase